MREFRVLRFMQAVKAAREFGLSDVHAENISLRFDPQRGSVDDTVDALAAALFDSGAVSVPETA